MKFMLIDLFNAAESNTGTTEDNKRAWADTVFHGELAAACGMAFSPADKSERLRMGKQYRERRTGPLMIKFSELGHLVTLPNTLLPHIKTWLYSLPDYLCIELSRAVSSGKHAFRQN